MMLTGFCVLLTVLLGLVLWLSSTYAPLLGELPYSSVLRLLGSFSKSFFGMIMASAGALVLFWIVFRSAGSAGRTVAETNRRLWIVIACVAVLAIAAPFSLELFDDGALSSKDLIIILREALIAAVSGAVLWLLLLRQVRKAPAELPVTLPPEQLVKSEPVLAAAIAKQALQVHEQRREERRQDESSAELEGQQTTTEPLLAVIGGRCEWNVQGDRAVVGADPTAVVLSSLSLPAREPYQATVTLLGSDGAELAQYHFEIDAEGYQLLGQPKTSVGQVNLERFDDDIAAKPTIGTIVANVERSDALAVTTPAIGAVVGEARIAFAIKKIDNDLLFLLEKPDPVLV